jgi:DNA polymerase I-like protein with 3'-5' exonuclease and polymerase domains
MYGILQGDLIQAEAVAVAYFTNDDRAKLAFKNKEDIHNITAGILFDKDPDDVSDEPIDGKPSERDIGKRGKHAYNYGSTFVMLMNALNIEAEEAQNLMQRIAIKFPLVTQYHNKIKDKLKLDMTLITPEPFLRKRTFIEKWGDELFRSAYAYQPQSVVGDILNTSIVKFYDRHGNDYRILAQLHDAIYSQVVVDKKAIIEAVKKKKECMTMPIKINNDIMIIDTDFSFGLNWRDQVKIVTDDKISDIQLKYKPKGEDKPRIFEFSEEILLEATK